MVPSTNLTVLHYPIPLSSPPLSTTTVTQSGTIMPTSPSRNDSSLPPDHISHPIFSPFYGIRPRHSLRPPIGHGLSFSSYSTALHAVCCLSVLHLQYPTPSFVLFRSSSLSSPSFASICPLLPSLTLSRPLLAVSPQAILPST
jgi:hypothetical protein